MDAGRLARHDPDAVVLAAYSMLTGLAVEVETQRALGMATELRALVRRERSVERLLPRRPGPLTAQRSVAKRAGRRSWRSNARRTNSSTRSA